MPSSVVKYYSYDPDTCTLRVTYVSGAVYDYLYVPEREYLNMKSGTSKGVYLNLHIKGKYEFIKIN